MNNKCRVRSFSETQFWRFHLLCLFSTFPYMTFLTTSFWSCCCCRSIVKHGSRKVEAAFSRMVIVVVVQGFSNTRYKIKTLKGIWKVRIEDQMTSKIDVVVAGNHKVENFWGWFARICSSPKLFYLDIIFIRGCKNSPNCNILYINFHTFSPTH